MLALEGFSFSFRHPVFNSSLSVPPPSLLCVCVCLFAVVGGMLCKSGKPFIVIVIVLLLFIMTISLKIRGATLYASVIFRGAQKRSNTSNMVAIGDWDLWDLFNLPPAPRACTGTTHFPHTPHLLPTAIPHAEGTASGLPSSLRREGEGARRPARQYQQWQ